MTTDGDSPLGSLDGYLDLPRVGEVVVTADGRTAVATVAELSPDRTSYRTALWAIDLVDPATPARRLTRSVKGETAPVPTPDGEVLFLSARPDPDAVDRDDDAPAAVWAIATDGGEARCVGSRPGGFEQVAVARSAGTVVAISDTLPGSSAESRDDATRRKVRTDLKVNAILHDAYPVRFWDHDLGPGQPRMVVASPGADLDEAGGAPGGGADGATDSATDSATDDGGGQQPAGLRWRDLTPSPGRALDGADLAVSDDGTTVVHTWHVPSQGGRRSTLRVMDTETGRSRVLADDPEVEWTGPSISPDGTMVAAEHAAMTTPTEPPLFTLSLLDLATGDRRDHRIPGDSPIGAPAWLPDGSAVVLGIDLDGRGPLIRMDVATGESVRLTGDHGCYRSAAITPDGRWIIAVRSAVDSPPAVVRLSVAEVDQQPEVLFAPTDIALPGTLAEVSTTAQDGTTVRAWLALPDGASADAPAPLLLWIHGGPLGSWNAWSWRWNPWLMVAQGWAVLLPDPALSTGYGVDFIRRSWGAWGDACYTDLMAITDATEARADIDQTTTAAMGGSFGGYMANWIAGHTDRFSAIVTHASLWALDQFGPTTDAYHYWHRELTPQMAADNSPHLHVDAITTPMLVIHGDKDYRVPIGDGLRLFAELAERHQGEDGTMPHKLLVYPDENHWILKPQHATLWYQTVMAFLDHHVHGADWVTPDLLT